MVAAFSLHALGSHPKPRKLNSGWWQGLWARWAGAHLACLVGCARLSKARRATTARTFKIGPAAWVVVLGAGRVHQAGSCELGVRDREPT